MPFCTVIAGCKGVASVKLKASTAYKRVADMWLTLPCMLCRSCCKMPFQRCPSRWAPVLFFLTVECIRAPGSSISKIIGCCQHHALDIMRPRWASESLCLFGAWSQSEGSDQVTLCRLSGCLCSGSIAETGCTHPGHTSCPPWFCGFHFPVWRALSGRPSHTGSLALLLLPAGRNSLGTNYAFESRHSLPNFSVLFVFNSQTSGQHNLTELPSCSAET